MVMTQALRNLTNKVSMETIKSNMELLGMNKGDLENFIPNNKTPFANQRYEWKKRTHPMFASLMEQIATSNYMINALECITLMQNVMASKGVTNEAFVEFVIQITAHDIFFLSNWARYKQVYKFDRDALGVIQDMQYEKVPTKAFDNLPYQAIYLDCQFKHEEYTYDGCYVAITKDGANKRRLGFDFVVNNESAYMSYGFLPLDDGDKSIEEYFSEYVVDTDIIPLIKQALPLLLYLCSVNKDVEIVVVNTKKKKEYVKSGCVENKVGYRLGASIKKTKHLYTYEHKTTKGNGSSKSPHFRKAHYHHYWVGARDSEERKLIVKFVEPMFINANDKDKLTTIHNVKV